jgi:hypothetical protein
MAAGVEVQGLPVVAEAVAAGQEEDNQDIKQKPLISVTTYRGFFIFPYSCIGVNFSIENSVSCL